MITKLKGTSSLNQNQNQGENNAVDNEALCQQILEEQKEKLKFFENKIGSKYLAYINIQKN
jgi:hypothetical protein